MKKVIQAALLVCFMVNCAATSIQAQSLESKKSELERAIKSMGIQDYKVTLNEVQKNKVVATTSFGSKAFAASRLKQVYKYENGSGDTNAQKVSLFIKKDGDKWSIFIEAGKTLTSTQLNNLSQILNK